MIQHHSRIFMEEDNLKRERYEFSQNEYSFLRGGSRERLEYAKSSRNIQVDMPTQVVWLFIWNQWSGLIPYLFIWE